MTGLSPAPIAVHDDGHVSGQAVFGQMAEVGQMRAHVRDFTISDRSTPITPGSFAPAPGRPKRWRASRRLTRPGSADRPARAEAVPSSVGLGSWIGSSREN